MARIARKCVCGNGLKVGGAQALVDISAKEKPHIIFVAKGKGRRKQRVIAGFGYAHIGDMETCVFAKRINQFAQLSVVSRFGARRFKEISEPMVEIE